MMPLGAELEEVASRLQVLVAQRRYPEAQDALAEYCRALRLAAAALPPGDPRLGRLETGWRRLAEETRRRVLTGRAHAAARLERLTQLTQLTQAPRPSQFYGVRHEPRPTREWLA
jgi:hypothetical protein